MAHQKYPVHLTDEEHTALTQFVSRGQKSAREITRARTLLLAHEGKTDAEITALLGISRPTICLTRRRHAENAAVAILPRLKDAPRDGRPIKVDSRVETNISMIACSEPPKGAARWTLHMIADRLVKLEIIDTISHERVRRALKKTN
jgi:transposase